MLALILGLLSTGGWAQSASSGSLSDTELLLWVMGVLGAAVLLLLIYVIALVVQITYYMGEHAQLSEFERAYREQPFWNKVFQLNPLKFEKQLVMDHAYDDIQELDNPTPPWFMGLFYITIAFGVVYLGMYHYAGWGSLQEDEYKQEIVAADIAREEYMKKFANSINEDNVTLLTDAKGIEAGALIYKQNCVACHGEKGEGKVGPNLTDNYWLHGGSIKAVFHTVNEGVPAKGMISWKKQLNPLQVQQVSSYVLSLVGTNPANPKEPQGELLAAADSASTATATDSSAVAASPDSASATTAQP